MHMCVFLVRGSLASNMCSEGTIALIKLKVYYCSEKRLKTRNT